jgi:hypothetical protein
VISPLFRELGAVVSATGVDGEVLGWAEGAWTVSGDDTEATPGLVTLVLAEISAAALAEVATRGYLAVRHSGEFRATATADATYALRADVVSLSSSVAEVEASLTDEHGQLIATLTTRFHARP